MLCVFPPIEASCIRPPSANVNIALRHLQAPFRWVSPALAEALCVDAHAAAGTADTHSDRGHDGVAIRLRPQFFQVAEFLELRDGLLTFLQTRGCMRKRRCERN